APDSTTDTAAWLKSLDQPEEQTPVAESSEEDALAWMADNSASETEADVPSEEAGDDSADLPDWLEGLDEEESEAPAVPGGDDLPAWMQDETGELVAEPTKIEPTQSTDWTPEEEKKAEADKDETPSPADPKPAPASTEVEPESKPDPAPEPEPEPVKKTAPKKKEAKPATPSQPDKEPVTKRKTAASEEMPVDPILETARAELSRSNIPGALETYGKLIKKGRFLEEVIYDLRDALYRYPVEVSIWQSLGDAYMRANQLQDALDAYTKAEELLR
ncbi:MAG: tetratricopeptide repeat protein, partial [Anaerolineales bacterium]|nr:tetratricopeptide repeat protein [Anaerolineales bacterium]